MNLTDRQHQIVDAVFDQWNTAASTLVSLPTGGGKTEIFCAIIKRRLPGRSMVLVHRDELVRQACNRLKRHGIEAEVEKASSHASHSLFNSKPCVVATVQTLAAGNGARRAKFDPRDFSTIIVDEAHHATSTTWKQTIKHFRDGNPDLRVAGFTATADRSDGEALSQIFQSIASHTDIIELIDDGYLVPITAKAVRVEGLDFSRCRTTAGDLNGADLAEVMQQEKVLHGIASATLKIAGSKRTLMFAASVQQAERLAEIFNRHEAGSAEFVSGMTLDHVRQDILKRFAAGEIRRLVNCAVLTEGFDDPGIECIVPKATKSRSLFAQMCGRGTRPSCTEIYGMPTAELRKATISASDKPNVLLLDFVGNAGKHTLCSPADLLGGHISDQAKARAKRKSETSDEGVDMLDALRKSEEEILAEIEAAKLRRETRRAGVTAEATYSETLVDVFGRLSEIRASQEKWKGHRQHDLSEKQRSRLIRGGWHPDDHTLSENLAEHKRLISASQAQRGFLRYMGAPEKVWNDPDLAVWDCAKLIDACVKNGKRWPNPYL